MSFSRGIGFSATLESYLAAPALNHLYGSLTSSFWRPEAALFPGVIPVAVAAPALFGTFRSIWRRQRTMAPSGELRPRAQPEGGVTMARRLRRRDGVIDWSLPAARIFDLMRGLTPWPGVSTSFRDQPLKVLWGRVVEGSPNRSGAPGTVLGLMGESLLVACGEGSVLAIERLQRSGRRAVDAAAFANGERLAEGERFG
jgi:methionyl-tRNA formyltransferase